MIQGTKYANKNKLKRTNSKTIVINVTGTKDKYRPHKSALEANSQTIGNYKINSIFF